MSHPTSSSIFVVASSLALVSMSTPSASAASTPDTLGFAVVASTILDFSRNVIAVAASRDKQFRVLTSLSEAP